MPDLKNISFRATLLTLMLAVLLLAAALLGTAAYLYARFAAGDLSEQILEQTSERIESHVLHALDTAEHEAETLRALLSGGPIDPGDHERITAQFVASLAARPSLSYLSFGMPSGKYLHASRDRGGELAVLWLLPEADGSRRLLEFSVVPGGSEGGGADGSRLELFREIPDSARTPPFERPYYLAAQAAGAAIWTGSYVFLGSGESLDVPGVSRAVPVFGEGGGLAGVLTADFDLFALSRALGEVSLGDGGVSFIVEVASGGEPRVIAHPAAVAGGAARLDLTEPAPDGEGRTTVRADKVADARVTGLLAEIGPGVASVPTALSPVFLKAGGTRYVGGYRHLGRESGPDWLICMLLPDAEVFGGVHRMAHRMALVGAGGLVVALLLSVMLSRRVSEKLGRIAGETRDIGQFRLSPKPPVPSRIREISTLAGAVEEMKTGLRSFQKYVPAELVRQLLESGEEAVLGGSRKTLTVYFSDIVGFTSISEQLDPDALAELLSTYLGEMSGEVMRNAGTVDKFIGDAIMAFWGAPRPDPGHAAAACRTALANQRRLAELRDHWVAAGIPPLYARIGLHSGEAVVGNFGSPDRLDFTAIGDTVNTASRLEGLNRSYGTEILVSGAVRDEAGDSFVMRKVDRVAVKGREAGFLVYELVGEEREDRPRGDFAWIGIYEAALDAYLAGEFGEALAGFGRVEEQRPGDGPAGVLAERCRGFVADPPPPDAWDGVFRAPK